MNDGTNISETSLNNSVDTPSLKDKSEDKNTLFGKVNRNKQDNVNDWNNTLKNGPRKTKFKAVKVLIKYLLIYLMPAAISIYATYSLLSSSSDSVGAGIGLYILSQVAFYILIALFAVLFVWKKIIRRNVDWGAVVILLGLLSGPILIIAFGWSLFYVEEFSSQIHKKVGESRIPVKIDNYNVSNFLHKPICNNNEIKPYNCEGVEVSFDMTVMKGGNYKISDFTTVSAVDLVKYNFVAYNNFEETIGKKIYKFKNNETQTVTLRLVPLFNKDVSVKEESRLFPIYLMINWDKEGEDMRVLMTGYANQYEHVTIFPEYDYERTILYFENLKIDNYDPSIFYFESKNDAKSTEPASCVDTDGGNKPFLKGEICGFIPGQEDEYCDKDKCLIYNLGENNTLLENYCINDVMTWEEVTCTNGCKDGACVRNSIDDK